MKEYFKTHSIYWYSAFVGKLDSRKKDYLEHIIMANGYEGRLGIFLGLNYFRIIPRITKTKLLINFGWLNFNITFGIADWKE